MRTLTDKEKMYVDSFKHNLLMMCKTMTSMNEDMLDTIVDKPEYGVCMKYIDRINGFINKELERNDNGK